MCWVSKTMAMCRLTICNNEYDYLIFDKFNKIFFARVEKRRHSQVWKEISERDAWCRIAHSNPSKSKGKRKRKNTHCCCRLKESLRSFGRL